jgi:predicted phage-related endonuclease
MSSSQRTPSASAHHREPRRMQVIRFPVTDRELWLERRKQDVTASAIGSLFGLNPHKSELRLWAEKSGTEFPDQEAETTALRRGRIMERAVGDAFLLDHPGWKIKPAKVYLRAPDYNLGATPDFFVTDPEGRRGIVQAKTVAPFIFRRDWTGDNVPTWIALQTLTEAMLAQVEFGMIATMEVDGFHFAMHYYTVPRHPSAERKIQDAALRFWANVRDGVQPNVDYEHDAGLLAVMFPHHTPNKTVDLRGDNRLPERLARRARRKRYIKLAEAQVDLIETELRSKMTDAEAALMGDGWSATLKEQHRKEVVQKAASFRVLRIKNQKEAAQ